MSENNPHPGSRTAIVGIAVLGLGLAAIGMAQNIRDRGAQRAAFAEQTGPRRVRVLRVKAGANVSEMLLAGTAAPIHTTLLYAKASGYLRRNLAEVGDQVAVGRRLAEIDARDVDQDVVLAEARLQEASANMGIAIDTATRQSQLAELGVTSRQQAEDARALSNSAKASMRTREADLKRLHTVRAYQEILAPYNAIVTRRGFDAGALVGPQSVGGAPLFEVADTTRLRVVLDVPQNLATGVRAGMDASVYLPDAPSKLVQGKVMRTAGVLDTSNRTLRVEVELPGGAILPGSFVYVTVKIPRIASPPLIPQAALLIRKEGTLVARVRDQHVQLIPVILGRDMGKEIEVSSGIEVGVELVQNPGDELNEGDSVVVVPEAP